MDDGRRGSRIRLSQNYNQVGLLEIFLYPFISSNLSYFWIQMQGKESPEENVAPLSIGFVMESRGRNRAQNGAVPSGPPLDSVPSNSSKEPNSRADWRIPVEQVSMQEPNFVAF